MSTDVCIIGGGITGIAVAYALSQRRIECIVLEAAKVGAGATGSSGGQLLAGTASEFDEIERKYGLDCARFLWDLSIEGLAKTKALAQTAGAPCDLHGGHISVAETPKQSDALRARTEYRAARLNYRSERVLSGPDLHAHISSPKYRIGVFDPNEGYLDSAAFVSNIAKAAERQGARIFEQSPVLSVDTKVGRIHLENASVKAQHIVFAAGPWIGKLKPHLLRYVSSVYVNTGIFEPPDGSTISDLLPSVAAVNDYYNVTTFSKPLRTGELALGGPCSMRPLTERSARELRSLMASIFPQARPWKCVNLRSAVLCISRDQLPVCGRDGGKAFWVAGYSGHGLTWATRLADLIADSLVGDTRQFDQLAGLPRHAIEPFAPIRPIFTPLGLACLKLLDRLHMNANAVLQPPRTA